MSNDKKRKCGDVYQYADVVKYLYDNDPYGQKTLFFLDNLENAVKTREYVQCPALKNTLLDKVEINAKYLETHAYLLDPAEEYIYDLAKYDNERYPNHVANNVAKDVDISVFLEMYGSK